MTMDSSSDNSQTILFVDDNTALLKSVDRLLRLEGFNVLLAADGDEALSIMESIHPRPDLIISDVAMPKVDGFEFFERVRRREEWLSIPFLFLTARDQIDDLRRGYSLGVDDYLVKPLDQERFLLVLRSKLKRRDELMSHIQVQQNALDVAKRELAMMVAHELRTPLVSISMVTEILSRELNRWNPIRSRICWIPCTAAASACRDWIEQMVMFVQLQSGALAGSIQQHLRPGYVQDAVLGAIDRAQQFSFRQRDIPVLFDELDPNAMVSGDMGALKHAMAELLSNAMAFSKPTDRITIEQWVDNGTVWLSIVDRGPGIPEDELLRVFEPYHQANRHKYEQQGVGIGLTLASGIIEAHGGTLELHSVVGKGTQALVGLPIWTQETDDF